MCGGTSGWEKISPCPSALSALKCSSWGLSAIPFIRATETLLLREKACSHCLSAACNTNRFSLSLPACRCSRRPRDKDGNLPTAVPDLIGMEMGLSLSSFYVHAFKCLSDVYLTMTANRAHRKQKDNLIFIFIFLPHWKTSEQPCYSSAYGIGTPNQSRNPVYCPSFALPCPLSEEKRHSKSIPFLYSAVPAETRRHALDDGDRKKKRKKGKKDGNIKQRVDSSSRDLFSSPFPPFSSSCIHTKTGSTGGRRQSDSDVFLFALWLFTSSFSCSPSRPRSHYLAFYPSAFLSVHGSSLHTGAGCSVVMGEETLPVQGHLWMCLCWETKVAS